MRCKCNFFQKYAPQCPERPKKFFIFLKSKPLFKSHHCAEPHFLLPCYPPHRLLHIPELKYHLVVLDVVILSGHSWSAHNADVLKG